MRQKTPDQKTHQKNPVSGASQCSTELNNSLNICKSLYIFQSKSYAVQIKTIEAEKRRN